MTPPDWALTLAFWLHMLATVVWVGGLVVLSLIVIPAGRRALDDQAYAALLDRIQARLDPIGWFSLTLLVATGLVQMVGNPNYEGFLAFGNRWALAILFKHLVFGLMIAISAYLTWGVLPALRRNALRIQRGITPPDESRQRRLEARLLRLNLLLSVIVLALTALARTS